MSKKLDRKDVKNAAWTWMFFHHCAQNFERMQGLAFCHTMSKPLEKLYGDDPEELKAALTRHMQFFNTEPQLGSVIPGITIALEAVSYTHLDVYKRQAWIWLEMSMQ